MLSIAPRVSASRRKVSNAPRNLERSCSRSSEIPCRIMLSAVLRALRPNRLKGECATPTKPPSPGSPQVRLPVAYINARLGGTAGLAGPCSLETHAPAEGQPPGGVRVDFLR